MTETFAGRYRLLRRLGKGGMGEVFLARDLTNGQECALKRLNPEAGFSEGRREFELLGRLRHPAVVSVLEFGIAPDGTPFYTMEYVPGVRADHALAIGDWPALFFFAADVAGALEALHSLPVFHGDLKPTNLLVLAGTVARNVPAAVRLLDFGLAAALGSALGHRGTPGYAAPEVVRGEPISRASDLYGLGSTLYTLCTGRLAFEGDTAATVLRRQQAGPPSALPLEEAGAPAALVQLVLRLMAPEPGERPEDAREVRRELEASHPAARRPLAARLQTVVFVGRERELALLEQRVTQPSPAPRIIVISGAAGAGKSALVRALSTRWTVAGRPVFPVACGTLPGRGAAGIALLRALAAEALPRAPGSTASEADETLLRSDEIGSESDLALLVEAAVSWYRRIHQRAGAPIVLLDDSDHLDPTSRALIRRLMLHPELSAGVWLWMRRAGEPPDDERALSEAGAVELLELGGLDRDQASRMVAARLAAPAPRDLDEFLWSRAHGHPGATVELLQFAAAQSALREGDTGLVTDADRLATLEVPPSFESMLVARLSALPREWRVTAAALAVLGVPAAAARIRALAHEADGPVLEGLVDSGLVTRDAEGRFALGSPGVAERLIASLAPETRQALHRALLADPALTHAERFRHLSGAGDWAAALAAADAAFAERPDAPLVAAATALAEAHEPESSGLWHERLGRELAEEGRYRAAVAPLTRALERASTPEQRGARLYLLSTAHLRSGEPHEVARLHDLARREELPPALASRFLTNEAARHQSLGDMTSSEAAGEQALALAEAADDDEAVGLAALALAYALVAQARHEHAEVMARRARESFERSGQARGRIRALGALGEVARARRDLASAERLYREALGEARSLGMRLMTEELLNNLAAVVAQAGRAKETREMYAEAARLALEDQRPRGAAVALANLAHTDGLGGRPRLARRQARAAIRLARAHLPRLEAMGWRALSQGYRNTGHLRKALRAARRSLELATRHPFGDDLDWSRIEYGRVLADRGRWKDAGDLWSYGLTASRTPSSVGFAVLHLLSGRAALRIGDPALAVSRLAAVEEWLKGRTFPYVGALAAQLRAELAIVRERVPEATAQVDKAAGALLALPAPAERAMALLEFARLADRGRGQAPARAGEWLEEAAAGFQRLGNRRARERALALRVESLKRASPTARVERQERSLIESVSQLLHSLSDLRELTQRAMQMAVEQLDAERGVLLLADPESGRLVPMAEHGAVDAATRSDAVGFSRRVVQRVTESGGALLIGDAPSDPASLSESMVDLRLRSIVCVPMFLGGRMIGAVYLDDARRPHAFGDADRGLLEGFAHLMAVAIEKSRGEEEVRRANEMLVGENLSLRQEAAVRFQAHRLIGTSLEMQRVRATIERIAQTQSTVLLTGENGTGKELIARIVHHTSKRRLKPFVAINCGAIPETLLESELFGILPNVATGVRGRDGRFQQADGGTLFLDEIGDMPLKQQVALLAVLANHEITPVGGGKAIHVDVRIMAATHKDLRRMVEDGTLREDLYYRLNVIPIEVPPLRDRKADIPMLAHHFVAHIAKIQERPLPQLSAEFLAALMQSDWPGNVREFQNYIERVLAMNPGDVLYPVPLPRDLEDRGATLRAGRGRGLARMVEDLERRTVEDALQRAQGNQSQAARQLGITEQAMRYRIRKYELGSARENRRVRRFHG